MSYPGQLVAQAARWASHLHADQRRKVSGAPYVSHLLGTAASVVAAGGDEIAVAAAFLHDAVEDQQATLSDARRELGPYAADVWRVVEACSDTTDGPRLNSWRERKGAYLARLDALADEPDLNFVRRVVAVSLSDKRYNAGSIEQELRTEGSAAFDRMAGKTDALRWYMPELATRLTLLARRTGDRALVTLAGDYSGLVDRIGRVHEILPNLRKEIPIGRAADFALGIDHIEIPDPHGPTVYLSVLLTPTRVRSVPGAHPLVGESAAAREPFFADAIAHAIETVVRDRYQGPRTRRWLAHAFSATAVALEHGGSTSEACTTMLLGRYQGLDAQGVASDEALGGFDHELGVDIAELLQRCRAFVPPRERVWVLRGLKVGATDPSVYRVLAADEVPRALQLERMVKAAPIDVAARAPQDQLQELEAFSAACTRHLGGSLALVLTDITTRVRTYLDVAGRLMDDVERLRPGSRPDDFVLRGPGGITYRVDVKSTGLGSRTRPSNTATR